MVTSRKAALSLLISVILFTVFAVFAFSGLFDLFESSFHNPAIIANLTRENDRNAEVIDGFFNEMQNRFSETLKTNAVKRSFLSNQNPEDVMARSRIYHLLINSFPGIQWVRFIDSGGRRLLFSTESQDILNQNETSPVYQNYNEPDLPYDVIGVDDGEAPKYTFDGRSERILFSFPLYDSFDIYWGTALFSVSIDAVLHRLITDRRIRFNQEIMVIPNPAGLVFWMPSAGERALPSQISSIWRIEGVNTTKLASPYSDISFALISTKTSQGFFVGRIVNETQFSFTMTIKIILLASFFLTVYLVIFLLLNFRQDPVTIIQNRLKQLQLSVFEQFYELKGEADWSHWIRELEHRRGEVTSHLKQDIKGIISGDIDALISKSWDELLKVMGSRREIDVNEEKIRSIIKEVLATLPSIAQPSASSFAVSRPGLLMKASALIQKIDDAELVEELEEIGELEELPADQSEAPVDVLSSVSSEDIAYLASKIEFSQEENITEEETETIEQYLEIVSPFSDMLQDLSSSDLDELHIVDEEDENVGKSEIIEERGGVPFISDEVLSPDSEDETVVNQDFKDLVDSIIK